MTQSMGRRRLCAGALAWLCGALLPASETTAPADAAEESPPP